MKQFTEYISESTTSPALTLSNDEIKNSIYKSLVGSKAKFVFKIKDVDSLLDKVDPTASWLRDVMSEIKPKRGSKVYRTAVWNGGSSWNDGSPYNQAEFVSYNNHTDVAWYCVVSGKKVDCWMRERRYYGMKSVVKLLKSFSI